MKKLLVTASLAALVGCVNPAPQAPVASASQPSTPAPDVSPSAPAPVPSATVAPSAAPGLSLGGGEALKPYNFRGIGGLYRDPILDQLYVVDAVDEDVTPRRYTMRKFDADGTFISTTALSPQGQPAPDGVDGVTFDYRGFPVYGYRDNERFELLKLVTATVMSFGPEDYPLTEQDRAGAGTVAAAGSELLVGVVSLEEDKGPAGAQKVKTGGKLIVARAEEDKAAKTLFQLPDPLYPTVRMAFAPSGTLYLAGPSKEGKLLIMKVDENQALTPLPISLAAVPDGLWVSPEGELWLAENRSNGPALLRRFGPAGETRGQAEARLAAGGHLTTIQGLVFDGEGHVVVAGRGFDAASKAKTGLFRFGRPQ